MKILSTLIRVYVEKSELDQTIQFYESLFQQKCSLRFSYEEKNLELAMIDHTLIIAGSREARHPFESTKATFLVSNLQAFATYLEKQGSTILEKLQQVPTGWNMLVEHPDGLRVEYVEHVQRG
jgi:predicted enzyme related to lactoylglutathione lyase